MEIGEFQRRIETLYGAKDRARGAEAGFLWLVEEVGELAEALRRGDEAALRHEIGDVLAWLSSLASLVGVELETAAARYAAGCPRCGASPCACERG